uniref:Uncharacterized protein n=1 Tax=Arundo donax TaxID=35708 RepID=A0A0A9FQN9_ARUDO
MQKGTQQHRSTTDDMNNLPSPFTCYLVTNRHNMVQATQTSNLLIANLSAGLTHNG